MSISTNNRILRPSEWSWGRSGREVSTQVLLEPIDVLFENFTVLNEFKGLGVVRVCFVHQEVKKDRAKGEVGNRD